MSGEHHFVKRQNVNGSVGLPCDFVRNPLGQGIHVLAEGVDGRKDPRVQYVAENQQVGWLSFISEPFSDFVHANGEIRALVEEIFHSEIALQLRHANGGGNGHHKGNKSDEGRRLFLARATSDAFQPLRINDGFDLLMVVLGLASIQPIVNADPNQRSPQTCQDEGRQYAQGRFDSKGTEGCNVAEEVGSKGCHRRQGRQGDGPANTGKRDAPGFFGRFPVGSLLLVAMQRMQ